MEIIVQIYKVLPKALLEEELIDDIITDRNRYLALRQREKEEEKRLRQAYREENVTPIAALQKWKAIPEYARELLLNNVLSRNLVEPISFLYDSMVQVSTPPRQVRTISIRSINRYII